METKQNISANGMKWKLSVLKVERFLLSVRGSSRMENLVYCISDHHSQQWFVVYVALQFKLRHIISISA